MNYLAHAYLSFHQPGLLVGNMISDFVKGKKQYDYPPEILKGIKLHRAIDEFTDTHEATRQAKEFFRPAYRLYAGAFTDVIFDYYLATIHPFFKTQKSCNNLLLKPTLCYNSSMIYYPLVSKNAALYATTELAIYLSLSCGHQAKLRRPCSAQCLSYRIRNSFQIFQQHLESLKQCYQSFFPN